MSGNNLARFRKGCGLSQAALAGRSGVSVNYLAQLEQTGATPGLYIARKLAKALGRVPEQLFPFLHMLQPGIGRYEQLAIKHREPVGQLTSEQNAVVLGTVPLMPEDMFQGLQHATWEVAWSTIAAFADWVKKFPGTPSKAEEKEAR